MPPLPARGSTSRREGKEFSKPATPPGWDARPLCQQPLHHGVKKPWHNTCASNPCMMCDAPHKHAVPPKPSSRSIQSLPGKPEHVSASAILWRPSSKARQVLGLQHRRQDRGQILGSDASRPCGARARSTRSSAGEFTPGPAESAIFGLPAATGIDCLDQPSLHCIRQTPPACSCAQLYLRFQTPPRTGQNSPNGRAIHAHIG